MKKLADEWGVLKYILVSWKTELPPEVKKPPATLEAIDCCLIKQVTINERPDTIQPAHACLNCSVCCVVASLKCVA